MLLWISEFDMYMPETVRITGRPEKELPINELPKKQMDQIYQEWKELDDLEDRGIIHLDVYNRNLIEAGRRVRNAYGKRKRRERKNEDES